MILKPDLSVIIATYNARDLIAAALESLLKQKTDKMVEIILIDSSTDDTAQFVEENFPPVKLFKFAQRKYCGDARNIGITRASADIVAFIDADCVAAPDWVEAVLRAQRGDYPVITGAVGNCATKNLVAWASYFAEFSQWIPESPTSLKKDIAGANMSYKKEIFRKHGQFISGTYCSDTEFQWRLQKEGVAVLFDPAAVVCHRSIAKLGDFLRHEFHHGRSFAAVRAKSQNFSGLKKLIYAGFSPLIAVKIFLKILYCNLKNRVYLRHFLKAIPLTILGVMQWSAGECCGYFRRQ